MKNRYSHLCLSVQGDNTNSSTPAIQWGCNSGDDAEQFFMGYNPYGRAETWNDWIWWPPPGHRNCLDVLYARFTNGNPVDFFQCNGTAAQGWTFR